jgi:glutathione S-transferase
MFNRIKGLGPPDEVRVAQAEADLDMVLGVYDKILANQKYLAGNEVTLADIFHLPNGSALQAFGYTTIFEKYEHVNKWFKDLQQRDTWVKTASLMG